MTQQCLGCGVEFQPEPLEVYEFPARRVTDLCEGCREAVRRAPDPISETLRRQLLSRQYNV